MVIGMSPPLTPQTLTMFTLGVSPCLLPHPYVPALSGRAPTLRYPSLSYPAPLLPNPWLNPFPAFPTLIPLHSPRPTPKPHPHSQVALKHLTMPPPFLPRLILPGTLLCLPLPLPRLILPGTLLCLPLPPLRASALLWVRPLKE